MEIKGVTLDEFDDIVSMVSATMYHDNVIVDNSAHALSGTRIRARLRTVISSIKVDGEKLSAPGARRSASDRYSVAACWHAYRDVLAELFRLYPDAVVRTGMAVYRGAVGFLADYPPTAYQNIGSMMSPRRMPDLCDCTDEMKDGHRVRTMLARHLEASETLAHAREQDRERREERADAERYIAIQTERERQDAALLETARQQSTTEWWPETSGSSLRPTSERR